MIEPRALASRIGRCFSSPSRHRSEQPYIEQMHVDHDRGRSISLGKPFLRQDEVQQIGATAAEFLRDGHVEVTGGLHRLDILEGEAVLTVMPSSAGLEIPGV